MADTAAAAVIFGEMFPMSTPPGLDDVSNDSGRHTRSGRDRRNEERDRAARHARRPILPLPHRLEFLEFREARLDAIETAKDAFDLGVAHSQNHTPPRGPDEYPLRLAGSVLTASFWNEQVRDNMVELAPFFAAWTSHTPTVTASSGTFTTVSIESRYLRVGKMVIWQGNVTITTAGTASGNIHVPPPATPFLSLTGGISWENQVTGNSGYASLEKTNNRLVLAKYDATSYIASGRRVGFNISYEVA